MNKPKDILNSTTPQIRNLISETLSVEKDYQYIQNLDANKKLEKEIAEKIKKIIEMETSE